MDEEYQALVRNHTWDLVPYHPRYNIISNKWVHKLKFNGDGTIQRYKVCLVAKGFHRTPGIDFTETISPVIKLVTFCIVLTLAVCFGWDVKQLDVNNEKQYIYVS